MSSMDKEIQEAKAAFEKKAAERDKKIALARFKYGLSYDAIGKRFGLSRQRIHQIVSKY